jgi:hypothetical protein
LRGMLRRWPTFGPNVIYFAKPNWRRRFPKHE